MGASYDRGRLLYQRRRYAQAAEEFRRELSADVGSADAHAMLGMSLLFAGDRAGAEAAMLQAVRLAPGLAYGHYALACLAVRRPEAGEGPGRVFRTIASRQVVAVRRRLDRARGHVMTAVQLDPRNADYFALLAGIAYDLRDPDAAIAAARQGLTANPVHARCKTLLGRALAMAGRTDEADRAFRQVLERDPESAPAHMAQGWHDLRAGRAAAAAEHFRQSLRLDPTQAGAQVAARHVRWLPFRPYAAFVRGAARLNTPRRASPAAGIGVAAATVGISAGLIAQNRGDGSMIGGVLLVGAAVFLSALWITARQSKTRG